MPINNTHYPLDAHIPHIHLYLHLLQLKQKQKQYQIMQFPYHKFKVIYTYRYYQKLRTILKLFFWPKLGKSYEHIHTY